MVGVHAIAVLVLAIGFTQGSYEDVYLEEGGYKGILIAINENVPYDLNILPNLRVNWF